jgi:hypothetical protein
LPTRIWSGPCASPWGHAAEFRSTHFNNACGAQDVEQFVSTPEPQNENRIGGNLLEPGQV